jgi:hypothetical protein
MDTATPVLVPDPQSPPAPPSPWRLPTRVAFRFFALYFFMYVISTQMLYGLLFIPTPQAVSTVLYKGLERFINHPIERVVVWTGTNVFHKTVTLGVSGSGDRMLNWIHCADLLIVAIIGTVIWSALDRRRMRYDRLYRWFRIFLRFALGTTMLSYGFSKAFPLQMPAPQLTRLLEPFGNFSPMGVLWYSIGASFPYERFVGIVEVVGGALLFFPRTQLVGALVVLGATIEVFMLNMTYDVPVKLFAFHLVVMSVVLIAPYAKSLITLTTRPRGQSWWASAAQLVIGVYLLWIGGYEAAQSVGQFGYNAPKPPLYGIWTVEKMTVDGVERAPLVTDYDRWRRVIVQDAGSIRFWRMDDTVFLLSKKLDEAARTMTLTDGKTPAGSLSYQQPAPDRLVFDGTVNGHAVHMETRLFDHNKMLLKTRGFNWVQEQPFNK